MSVTEEFCKQTLRKFMSFLHEYRYPKDQEFPEALLNSIIPHDVYRWFTEVAYKNPHPGPDDKPVCRPLLLQRMQTALSTFMPNKDVDWDQKEKTGNPLRSKKVNDLIERVKQASLPDVSKARGNNVDADTPGDDEKDDELYEAALLGQTKHNYHRVLREFMAFLHEPPDGCAFDFDHKFTDDELRAITPDAICRYLSHKAFSGKSDDDLTVSLNTVLFLKKAISHFVLDKAPSWNPVTQEGNPTKSKEVNALIKRVRLLEAKKNEETGKSSKKRKAELRKEILDQRKIPKKAREANYEMLALMRDQNSQFMQFHHHLATIHYRSGQTLQLMHGMLSSSSKMICEELEKMGDARPPKTEWEKDTMPTMNFPDLPPLDPQFNQDLQKPAKRAKLNKSEKKSTFPPPNPYCYPLTAAPFAVGTTAGQIRPKTKGRHKVKNIPQIPPNPYLTRMLPFMDKVIPGGPPSTRPNKNGSNHTKTPASGGKKATLSKLSTLNGLWREYKDGVNGSKPAKDFDSLERQSNYPIYYIRTYFWNLMENLIKRGYLSDEAIKMIQNVYGKDIPSVLEQIKSDTEKGIDPCIKVDGNLRKKKSSNKETTESEATLSPVCDSLEDLWREFQFGVDGLKPAKDFTAKEKEKAGDVYEQRKCCWTLIGKMIKSGYSLDEAVGMIHHLYGVDLAEVMEKIKEDAENYGEGMNPNLSIDSDYRKSIMPYVAKASLAKIPSKGRSLKEILQDLWQEYDVGIDGKKAAKLFTAEERGECKTRYCLRKKFWDKMEDLIEKGFSVDDAIEKIIVDCGVPKSCTTLLYRLRDDQNNMTPEENEPRLFASTFDEPEQGRRRATLAPLTIIGTLKTLWDEYSVGIYGSVPASEFTALERSRCKQLYYRRLRFWSLVEELTENGDSPDEAIQKISDVYKGLAITKVLQEISKDRQNPEGMHPDLVSHVSIVDESE